MAVGSPRPARGGAGGLTPFLLHPLPPPHPRAGTRERQGDSTQSGPVRVPGQAVLRPLRHPHLPRRSGRHGGRGRRAGRVRGLPRRGQGSGEGGRPRQGGRREAGRRRRRGPPARGQHPRARHQGPRREAALDRARLGHRQGVLRQLHARPPGQAAPRHAVRRGRGRDRGSGGDQPRRHREDPHRPRRGYHRGAGARLGGSGQPRSRGAGAGGDAARPALPLLRRGRLRPGRDQPLDPHARGQGARARCQGDARRERHVPPPRVGGVRGRLRHRSPREDGQGEGAELHRPRRDPWASSPTAPAWP